MSRARTSSPALTLPDVPDDDLRPPELWCPFPHQAHPLAEGLDDRLLIWARRWDLVRGEAAARRFRAAAFGQFTAETNPRAVRLELLAEWNGLAWVVNDRLDEGDNGTPHEARVRLAQELMAQLPLGLRSAPRPAGALDAALADLWRRTAGPMSWAWRRRFTAHYRGWLASSLLSHAPRERRDPADLHAFVRLRRLNSGCEMAFDLIEVGNRREVSPQIAECDAYRAVRRAANDAVSWHNDLYSLRRELARDHHDHLPAVLRGSGPRRRTWPNAIARAARLAEELTRDFRAACEDLRAMRPLFADVDVAEAAWGRAEASLTDLGLWIAGSLHWHQHSARYAA